MHRFQMQKRRLVVTILEVMEFCAMFGGGKKVDGYGVYGGSFGSIENKPVLFAFLHKAMM